jgi:hypothetical protein
MTVRANARAPRRGRIGLAGRSRPVRARVAGRDEEQLWVAPRRCPLPGRAARDQDVEGPDQRPAGGEDLVYPRVAPDEDLAAARDVRDLGLADPAAVTAGQAGRAPRGGAGRVLAVGGQLRRVVLGSARRVAFTRCARSVIQDLRRRVVLRPGVDLARGVGGGLGGEQHPLRALQLGDRRADAGQVEGE